MPAIRGAKSKRKTRRYTRDADQIHADVHEDGHLRRYTDTKAAEDLPGLGQWYCVECARWFEAEANLLSHTKSKPHKRMLKQLKETPYSHKEAEAAGGLGKHDFYLAREQQAEEARLVTGVDKMEVQPVA